MFDYNDDIIVPEGAYLMGDMKHFMLRARQVGARIQLDQLKALRDIAAEYGEHRLRIAARQNFQLYGFKEEDVEPVKARLVEIGLPAMGRFSDIAINPDSGVRANEAFDVTPYAFALSDWIKTADAAKNLPGKYKMSFSSTLLDSGNACYGDFAAFAFVEDGKPYFKIYGGGSLGAMARLAICVDEKVPAENVIIAAEAIALVFADLFKGIDIGKKRMRFKLREIGDEEFIARYQAAKASIDANRLRLSLPTVTEKARPWAGGQASAHPAIHPTKFDGIVSLRLHTIDGMLSLAQVNALIDCLDGLGHDTELALDSAHGLWLRDIAAGEADAILSALEPIWGNQQQPTLINCRGKGICRHGLAATAPVINAIRQLNRTDLPTIHVSGCMNSCGRHQVAALGFWGKLAANVNEDLFNVVIGGRIQEGGGARMAVSVGDVTRAGIRPFMEALLELKSAEPEADWSDFLLAHKDDVAALLAK